MPTSVLPIFLAILVMLFLYFRSIFRKNENLTNLFRPRLQITIIIINSIGILTFILPWINLPLVGTKNAIELTSKVFSTTIQEEVLVSIVILSFFYLVTIIGSIIQMRNKIKKQKITLYIESVIGLLISLKGIQTIIHFKEIWNSPTDSFIGNALAMSASPGIGLYLIVFLGISQIVLLFTIKN